MRGRGEETARVGVNAQKQFDAVAQIGVSLTGCIEVGGTLFRGLFQRFVK
jgi:hypothetical protein